MTASPPLAVVPLAFIDSRTGISALALQHVQHDARVVLLYHDAPGPAATLPLVGAIARSLRARLALGQALTIIETSMPEHPAETFVYAQAALRCHDLDDEVEVASLRAISADRAARACGITREELRRTEQLVTAIHRPRGCAFPGFTELHLDVAADAARAA